MFTGLLIGLVVGFIIGILVGRKNKQSVEKLYAEVKSELTKIKDKL